MSNVSFVDANNCVSTKESRDKLMSLLNAKEQKMFKDFVKSLTKQ